MPDIERTSAWLHEYDKMVCFAPGHAREVVIAMAEALEGYRLVAVERATNHVVSTFLLPTRCPCCGCKMPLPHGP